LPISVSQLALPHAASGAIAPKRTLDRARPADFQTETEIEFLARRGIPKGVLAVAARRAIDHGTSPLQEMFALGFGKQRYWSMLAGDLGVAFVDDLSGATLEADSGLLSIEAVRRAASVLVRLNGRPLLVTAPARDELRLLRRRLHSMPELRSRIAIATPETIRAFNVARRHTALSRYALNRLAGVLPRLSSGQVYAKGMRGPMALVAAALGILFLAPFTTIFAMMVLSSLFFVNCSFWKLATAFRRLRPLKLEPLSDRQLPSYAVLVPLYREAAVVRDLVTHLTRLDYPPAKLQILLLIEADDHETRNALAEHVTAPHFEIVTVPPRGPRTKPNALTYALSFVRSDFVVVFDAEDRPEPGQLRQAAAAFREQPDLGCVQARLTPDNDDSWLSRMFAVEYAANFDVVLPALAEWKAPLPLGGTSNHFPRAVLERVAAWDPYNVTEDADLGIRLARFGYQTATIRARTYEEAPVTLRQWLPQRRRWIKGWIQTVALSFGRGVPDHLKLPVAQRLAMHGVLTGGVLGLLFYPAAFWLVAVAISAALTGNWPASSLTLALLIINLGNLFVVLLAAAVSSLRGLAAARLLKLVWCIPLLPIYWALMSFAAWQALFQFFRNPSAWEKTTHGVARKRRAPRRIAF
jgi:glycosyltransferase XagB